LCPQHPVRLFPPPLPIPYYQIFPYNAALGPPCATAVCTDNKAPAEFVQIGIGADNLFWVLAGTVKLKRNYRPNKNKSERPAGCHSIRGQADLQVLVLTSIAPTSPLFERFLSDLRASPCQLRRRMFGRVWRRVVC
jgi:hypothetical protein